METNICEFEATWSTIYLHVENIPLCIHINYVQNEEKPKMF